MEITIEAVLFKKELPEVFRIRVDENNFIIVRKKLESVREKIIDYLKKLKDEGKIKSVCCPKNKQMKLELNNLVKAKKTIKSSIDKIKELYYK